MRISHSKKFVFFANPKTGSTSGRKILDPYSEIDGVPKSETTADFPFHSHMPPAELKPVFDERGWDWDAYHKFTFVRNPWSRLVSLYEMVMRKQQGGFAKRNSKVRQLLRPRPLEITKFGKWIDSIDTDKRGGAPDGCGARWLRYGTYTLHNYVSDASGHELIDEVLKLEELDDAFPELLGRLDIPQPKRIPQRNKGRYGREYRYYYSDELAEKVGEMYADDIERFGYEFLRLAPGAPWEAP